MRQKLAGSAVWRVGAMCLLAFVVYGGWAFGVNYAHGYDVALTAGLAQGVSSTISTVIISALIEYCFDRFRHRRAGLALAWFIPPTLTGLMHAGFQWVVGTPEIVVTVMFSVVMGYIFGALYVRGLMRLKPVAAAG